MYNIHIKYYADRNNTKISMNMLYQNKSQMRGILKKNRVLSSRRSECQTLENMLNLQRNILSFKNAYVHRITKSGI